jgi:hypothetical protein
MSGHSNYGIFKSSTLTATDRIRGCDAMRRGAQRSSMCASES